MGQSSEAVIPPAAKSVREALESLGQNEAWLGRQLNVGTGSVSRWLSGERSMNLPMALKIQALLGVDTSLWVREPSGSGEHPAVVIPSTGTGSR